MEELFDLLAFPFDHTDLADILQKHHELIATGTTHDIRSPEHGLQTYCQAAEHFISEGMSHSIIDLLKVINIQYEQYAFTRLEEDGSYTITNCCAVAGLGGDSKRYRDGSFEYYISEPIIENDPKSVGSFILAAIEYEKMTKK